MPSLKALLGATSVYTPLDRTCSHPTTRETGKPGCQLRGRVSVQLQCRVALIKEKGKCGEWGTTNSSLPYEETKAILSSVTEKK